LLQMGLGAWRKLGDFLKALPRWPALKQLPRRLPSLAATSIPQCSSLPSGGNGREMTVVLTL
jgi:hypothetical protein